MKEAPISVELLWATPNPVTAVERAGRTCYKSEKSCEECGGSGKIKLLGVLQEGNPGFEAWKPCQSCIGHSCEFVRKLLNAKPYPHEAMIEHAAASFRFVCDRGVTHELVRHRLASYGQESTRYCNYAKDKFGNEITVIRPPGLTDKQWRRRQDVYEAVQDLYLVELEEGIKPQIARGILPISLKTEIVVTANFREWRHMMKLRTNGRAHPQIRLAMFYVYEIFNTNWPVFVEDITPDVDGIEIPADYSAPEPI